MQKIGKVWAVLLVAMAACVVGTSHAAETLSVDILKRFSPRASDDLVAALVAHQQFLEDAEINTPLRLAHFLTQIATETGGLRRIDENMNYSAKRMREVFGKRVSPATARTLAGKPQETANYLYGDRLGNQGRHTNDGWDYRGSGFIQLTGRYNFKKRGEEVGLPLEARPELARRPKEGLLAATGYWTARAINTAAEADDLKRVRVLVNGKRAHGYAASKVWYNKAAMLLVGEETSTETDFRALVDLLAELNFLEQSSEEAMPDEDSVSEALREFQKSRGISETGIFDEETLYAITDPDEWQGAELGASEELDVPSDSALESAQALDSGISYVISTGAETYVSGDPILPERADAESIEGSGEVSAETQLTQAELDSLSEMEASYAPYEELEGIRDADDNFIPYSVIEPDTREVVVNTTLFPSRAIVQISFTRPSNGRSYGCTGTMISASVVLTAGHCVHGGGPNGEWHSDFWVYPGRNGGVKPFGSCAATELYSTEGWVNSPSSDERRLHDVGAIALDCDVGEKTGWFGISTFADPGIGSEAVIQGYPCDKTPAGRAWISRGLVQEAIPSKLFYQNDTYGCMSGAPVFSGPPYSVFAVHTNGLHNGEPWSSNNAGTRLTGVDIQNLHLWMGN